MQTSQTFQINIPPILIIGAGAINQAGEQARWLGMKRVLIVTDPHIKKVGYADQVRKSLFDAEVDSVIYDAVTPDPTVTNVEQALYDLRKGRCEGLVAIGGGSSIDIAKAVAVMATNDGWIGDYMGYHKVPKPGLPLIAIPTTAGTGSEVTKVTVITDTKRNVKMMCLDRHFLPTAALVDYELTLSMPKSLTAAVGIDSLTHAIEAYVSKRANPYTDMVALSTIRLISKNIRTAYFEPSNRAAREAMMLAATQGGIAFSNSSVCLVHGMSRPIGAYFHVPHGLSNAMLIPAVTEFSITAAPERYSMVAKEMGENIEGLNAMEAARKLVYALKKLNRDLEVPSPKEYGIDKSKYEQVVWDMAKAALESGSPANNPRVPTEAEIVELYLKVY
jgi:alcohol dehydrogenase class IV